MGKVKINAKFATAPDLGAEEKYFTFAEVNIYLASISSKFANRFR